MLFITHPINNYSRMPIGLSMKLKRTKNKYNLTLIHLGIERNERKRLIQKSEI